MIGSCILRADAGGTVGTGHVTRLLSFGAWWTRSGGSAYFFGSAPAAFRERALSRRVEWIESIDDESLVSAQPLVKAAHDRDAAWACIDGYQFDSSFVGQLRDAGLRVLQFADGIMWPNYTPDLLVDQNLFAERRRYPVAGHCEVLAGSPYACIDPAFLRQRESRRTRDIVETVLLTMGGADPHGSTLVAIEAVRRVRSIKRCIVAVGASNARRHEIEMACEEDARFMVVNNATNMPELMASADLAIAAAGTTSWELAVLGVPAVLAITADNQAPIAAAMQEAGAGLSVGDARNADPSVFEAGVRRLVDDAELRRKISVTARRIVDGWGGKRIVEAMDQLGR